MLVGVTAPDDISIGDAEICGDSISSGLDTIRTQLGELILDNQ
jgi:hypothetical protein